MIAKTLLVLDLSENQFEVLPECVSYLQSLSALVVKGNRLVTFEYRGRTPQFTQTLQVSDNATGGILTLGFTNDVAEGPRNLFDGTSEQSTLQVNCLTLEKAKTEGDRVESEC